MLSLVQMAGMTLGLVVGLMADTIGLRRSLSIGLGLLTLASACGAVVGMSGLPGSQAINLLLWLRGLEGMGFLLVVMPAAGLIRAMTPPAAVKTAFGMWGTYMPLGVALALLFGPLVIAWIDWPGWWLTLSVISAAITVWFLINVPPDELRSVAPSKSPIIFSWRARLRTTLGSRRPWLVALAFTVYSSQWIAVIGFLPSIYADAGLQTGWSAILTAVAAAMNIAGNLIGGYLLQRGVSPGHLLRGGYALMAAGSIVAFAKFGDNGDATVLLPILRYLSICAFSLGGGLVPATLFLLAVRAAPNTMTVSTTVGLVQQASAMGQFVGPPLVAWLAHQVGGWQWTWAVTVPCSIIGIILATHLNNHYGRDSADP
jgi:CP family cyanate transporter-like MFS transporter